MFISKFLPQKFYSNFNADSFTQDNYLATLDHARTSPFNQKLFRFILKFREPHKKMKNIFQFFFFGGTGGDQVNFLS